MISESRAAELSIAWVETFLDEGFNRFEQEFCEIEQELFDHLDNLDAIIHNIECDADTPAYLVPMSKWLLENNYEAEALEVAEIASKLRDDFLQFKNLKEGDDVWCLINGRGKFCRVYKDKVMINFVGKMNNVIYTNIGQLSLNGAITLFNSRTAYVNALIALTESQL